MKDSWCSPIWDGTQMLYGAAAREYRLRLAGGVETVIRNSAENATRQALDTINGISAAVTNPKSNVVPMDKSAARPRRSA
ncbi:MULTISPECIES: hypothetical protein [Halomonas]|uniref:hypothetical protein n=1 Tax=Halomonas TaxID=2745 RepID=UPI001869157E|nr:hypothetical protein [Halomonas citrativorans]